MAYYITDSEAAAYAEPPMLPENFDDEAGLLIWCEAEVVQGNLAARVGGLVVAKEYDHRTATLALLNEPVNHPHNTSSDKANTLGQLYGFNMDEATEISPVPQLTPRVTRAHIARQASLGKIGMKFQSFTSDREGSPLK